MAFRIYNTLSRKKEVFKPILGKTVKMYTCGPTVYDYSHLGHAKGYVSMDIIRRYLEWQGYKVKYVQNFTDVGHLTDDADQGEDKIEKRAKERKVNPWKLVNQYIKAYYNDFRALNVKDPDIAPRPSEHIKEIISFIQKLIKKGYAYETADGSIYFDISKFKNYGKLSGKKIKDLIAGKRIEVRLEKKNPGDFALWIKAEPRHIMKWESPWSIGYPGWHIECSVMSRKYLGDTFDIHGGGIENIFPHNESEIAQSESLTGKRMANFWVLWNMVNIKGAKMSKSKGNFTMIRDLLKKYDPMVIRLAILKTHYRSPIDFNEKMFEESKKNLELIKNTITRLKKITGNISNKQGLSKPFDVKYWLKEDKKLFIAAMNEDFNTPLAFSILFGFIQDVSDNQNMNNLTEQEVKTILTFLYDLDKVLALGLDKVRTEKIPAGIKKLADGREVARKAGDFQRADKIRNEVEKLGYLIEDTQTGPRLRKK